MGRQVAAGGGGGERKNKGKAEAGRSVSAVEEWRKMRGGNGQDGAQQRQTLDTKSQGECPEPHPGQCFGRFASTFLWMHCLSVLVGFIHVHTSHTRDSQGSKRRAASCVCSAAVRDELVSRVRHAMAKSSLAMTTFGWCQQPMSPPVEATQKYGINTKSIRCLRLL